MGICLTSKYKGAPSLDGGYFMLHQIRIRLAKAWDTEFGEHYQHLPSLIWEEDYQKFNQRTSEILEQERFTDEDIPLIKFWFASDAGGKTDYRTCKKLADLLTFIYTNKTEDFAQISLRYQAYSKNDWEDLLELLRGCYSHRANLIWY